MDHRVFISFASQDESTALRICQLLEDRGVRCWISCRDMSPGVEYGAEIIREIERADAVVLLLSEHANESKFVKREIERAVSKSKAVFPVRLRQVQPCHALELFISSPQWVEAWSPPLDDKIDRLAAAIRELGTKPSDRKEMDRRDRPATSGRRQLVIGALVTAAVFALGWLVLLLTDARRRDRGPTPTTSGVGQPMPSNVLSSDVAEPLDLAYRSARAGQSPEATMDVWVQHPDAPDAEWGILQDGNELSSADRYRIAVRSHEQCWVYVFQIDATGRLDWLFPRNGSPYSFGANPVEPGAWVQIPARDDAFQLDDNLGIEHVFAVATCDRWDELEHALEKARRSGAGAAPVTSHLGFRTARRGWRGAGPTSRPFA